jgi:uncharacterized cupredoxin-like copper-binding protein
VSLRISLVLVLGLALLAAAPVTAQTGGAPAPSPSPSAQNELVVGSDGTIYLVKNGQRHAITPAPLSDDDLAAIPQGDAYTDGRIPTDGGSSLFATDPAPATNASQAAAPAPVPALTPAPTATPLPTVAALPSTANVDLSEWSISPDAHTLAAGKVQFNAANTGKGAHEMVIFKSDKDPASLPVSKGKVDEGALGQKIGELEGLGAGTKKSERFDLTPGTYILLCNLTNHYNKGMVSQVEVK